jgi:hypothetical protein
MGANILPPPLAVNCKSEGKVHSLPLLGLPDPRIVALTTRRSVPPRKYPVCSLLCTQLYFPLYSKFFTVINGNPFDSIFVDVSNSECNVNKSADFSVFVQAHNFLTWSAVHTPKFLSVGHRPVNTDFGSMLTRCVRYLLRGWKLVYKHGKCRLNQNKTFVLSQVLS